MAQGSEDYRKGKILPYPVTPASNVCFKIVIPNAAPYRAALFGVLGQLSQWYTWDHPVDGTDCPECYEAAQLWSKALLSAYFDEECEPMIDCIEVANCITSNVETQDALISQLTNNQGMQAAIQQVISGQVQPGVIATVGKPMTSSQLNGKLNPLIGCDHNQFWAQCEQFTNYMITAGTDTFEQIEVYSNALEAAQFIEMIPVLGTLMDEAQIDQVLEFINWTQEGVYEAYVAADTIGNRQEIACSLFCAGFDDCLITIERTWLVMNDRTGNILNPSSITTLAELAEAIVTVGTSPSLPLDLWIAFIAGAAKFAGYLGVRGIDQSLQLVLKLAVNDANNDWETLCVDCGIVDPCAGGVFYDYKIGEQTWSPTVANYAFYRAGEGWERGTFDVKRIGINKTITTPITSVVLRFTANPSTILTLGVARVFPRWKGYNETAYQQTNIFTLIETGVYEAVIAGMTVPSGEGLFIDIGASETIDASVRLISACVK